MRFTRRLSLILLYAMSGTVSTALAQSPDIPNRSEPLPGITSAGQPSAEALAALAEEGYTTVVDLRSEQEDRGFDEASTVEGLGMRYLSLPVAGGENVSYENAAALDRILAEVEGPVLLHCASGNRVGALLSLRAALNGTDKEEAMALGTSAGLTSLQPLVERLLNEEPPQ